MMAWIATSLATCTVNLATAFPESTSSDTPSGQFYDVLHLFSLTGEPTEKHCLLMNGDLVDRGSWSIEVILLAFAWKCEFIESS